MFSAKYVIPHHLSFYVEYLNSLVDDQYNLYLEKVLRHPEIADVLQRNLLYSLRLINQRLVEVYSQCPVEIHYQEVVAIS